MHYSCTNVCFLRNIWWIGSCRTTISFLLCTCYILICFLVVRNVFPFLSVHCSYSLYYFFCVYWAFFHERALSNLWDFSGNYVANNLSLISSIQPHWFFCTYILIAAVVFLTGINMCLWWVRYSYIMFRVGNIFQWWLISSYTFMCASVWSIVDLFVELNFLLVWCFIVNRGVAKIPPNTR